MEKSDKRTYVVYAMVVAILLISIYLSAYTDIYLRKHYSFANYSQILIIFGLTALVLTIVWTTWPGRFKVKPNIKDIKGELMFAFVFISGGLLLDLTGPVYEASFSEVMALNIGFVSLINLFWIPTMGGRIVQWKTYVSMISPIGALLLIAMLPEMRHQVTNSFFAGVLLGAPAWSVIALIEKRRIGPNNYPLLFIILLVSTSNLVWVSGNYVYTNIWASGYAIIALVQGIFLPCRTVYFTIERWGGMGSDAYMN